MTLNILLMVAPVALSLTACGISANHSGATSQMKHVPVKGFSVCESEVSIQGDPHAKIYAQRAIFAPDMKDVSILGYETRAMNLSEDKDIFNEDYQTSINTYDLALKAGTSTIEIYSKDDHKLLGSIQPVNEAKPQIILTLKGERETLNCRRSGQ